MLWHAHLTLKPAIAGFDPSQTNATADNASASCTLSKCCRSEDCDATVLDVKPTRNAALSQRRRGSTHYKQWVSTPLLLIWWLSSDILSCAVWYRLYRVPGLLPSSSISIPGFESCHASTCDFERAIRVGSENLSATTDCHSQTGGAGENRERACCQGNNILWPDGESSGVLGGTQNLKEPRLLSL